MSRSAEMSGLTELKGHAFSVKSQVHVTKEHVKIFVRESTIPQYGFVAECLKELFH